MLRTDTSRALARLALPLALAFGTLIPSPSRGAEADVVAEADGLYAQRSISSQAEAALEALRTGVTTYPDSYALQWRLARICWWIAEGTDDRDTKQALGKEGWDAGERAVALDPAGIEGHYWTALAMGEYAKGISIIKAISQGLDKKFNGHLDKVLSADEGYDDGGALRARGIYWQSLPRIMRSYPKALEYLERSDELVPSHPRTLYYLAQTHHLDGDDERARQYLDACLAATAWPDAPERLRVLAWARALDGVLP